MRVSVIIPTHNEAQAIGRVLADLPSTLVNEVIVVDSNSTDGTQDLARSMGAQVIQEPRRGYGRACLTGLANTENPEVVVFLDGDYSDRPSELPLVLAPIIEGRGDITLGSRLRGHSNSGALPWHQSVGNRVAAGLIRLLFSVRLSDLGPFRAGRANVLRALALEEATYGWAVEMLLKGGHRRISYRRGPCELLSANWKVQNQRYGQGDAWSNVVHPEPDRALLFSFSKSGHAGTGLSFEVQDCHRIL